MKLKQHFKNACTHTLNLCDRIFHQIPKSIFQKIDSSIGERIRDVFAAVSHSDAMPAHQRHLNEFKALAGGAATVAGLLELNPFIASGGAIPVSEAAIELEHAGHKWRQAHSNHRLRM